MALLVKQNFKLKIANSSIAAHTIVLFSLPSTELPVSGSMGIISARYIKAPLLR